MTVRQPAAADGWVRHAVSREQLDDDSVGPILLEMEAEPCPEWNDTADRSPIYKSYWAQWDSMVARDGGLERHSVSRQNVQDSSKSSSPEKSKGITGTPPWRIFGNTSRYNETVQKAR
jgi:hypothetical protein